MKKILLVFILTAGAYGLKAQQLLEAKPGENSPNKLFDQYLKSKPGDQSLSHITRADVYSPVANLLATTAKVSSVDHMPIAILNGHSKMPVAKLGGYYTMPVKKIGGQGPITVERNALPDMPRSKTP